MKYLVASVSCFVLCLLIWVAAYGETVNYTYLLSSIPNKDSKTYILSVDEWYILPTDEQVEEQLNKLPYHRYITDTADCDDFVFQAKGHLAFTGWPVAFDAVPGHYLLAWYNVQHVWRFMDAQTLQYRKTPEKIYAFIF